MSWQERLTQSSTTKTAAHQAAVSAVVNELASKEQKLTEAIAARAADKERADEKLQQVLDRTNKLLYEHDVMIRATTNGRLTPALTETLVPASNFFKARLSGPYHTVIAGQGTPIVDIDDANPSAINALMHELHLPGATDASSIPPVVAFEVLQLIDRLGGPAPPTSDAVQTGTTASTPPNDLMRRAGGVFCTALGNAHSDLDASEVAALSQALMIAIERADGMAQQWLGDMWRAAVDSCATTIGQARTALFAASIKAATEQGSCLADLSPAALLCIIDKPAVPAKKKMILIAAWTLSTDLSKLSSSRLDDGPAAKLAAVKKQEETSYNLLLCLWILRTLLNGTVASHLTSNEIRAKLADLAVDLTSDQSESDEALQCMLHDALSITVQTPPADTELLRLWEVMVDALASHFPWGHSIHEQLGGGGGGGGYVDVVATTFPDAAEHLRIFSVGLEMHRCQPFRGIQGGILSEERRNQTVQHVKKIVRDILTYWDQQVFPRRPRPTATSIFELLTIVPEIDALACMRDPSEEAAAARQRFLEISMAPQAQRS